MYYQFAIGVVKEVRMSEAPAMMPEGFWRSYLCGHQFLLPTTKMGVVISAFLVFAALMLFISLFTHPAMYVDKLSKDPYHIASIALAYLIVIVYMSRFALTMFRITMIFRKAYALMKIPSNPLAHMTKNSRIQAEEEREKEEETYMP